MDKIGFFPARKAQDVCWEVVTPPLHALTASHGVKRIESGGSELGGF
jgi:hypothetical protein